jgi:acyl carrier protein
VTETEIRDAMLRVLARVAPEIEPSTLKGDVPLRSQVDIDSIDFLNFLIGIHEQLAVDVPETDYHEFLTLDRAVTYLAARLQAQPAAPSPTVNAR